MYKVMDYLATHSGSDAVLSVVKNFDEYTWRVYDHDRGTSLVKAGSGLKHKLVKGTRWGSRPALSKATVWRVVFEDTGPTKVFSIDDKTYQKLADRSRMARGMQGKKAVLPAVVKPAVKPGPKVNVQTRTTVVKPGAKVTNKVGTATVTKLLIWKRATQNIDMTPALGINENIQFLSDSDPKKMLIYHDKMAGLHEKAGDVATRKYPKDSKEYLKGQAHYGLAQLHFKLYRKYYSTYVRSVPAKDKKSDPILKSYSLRGGPIWKKNMFYRGPLGSKTK